jgi:hypothetical protein
MTTSNLAGLSGSRRRRPADWGRLGLHATWLEAVAWRLGRDAAVVLRPEGALDAEGERAVPLDQWSGFAWNAVHEQWEQAS